MLKSQAIDFGILSIAISTMALVNSPTHDFKPSLLFRCVACGLVWLIGLMTSKYLGSLSSTRLIYAGCIALGLQAFGPVSGNWCWIQKNRLALRYGLAHGWRFGVILGICAIYVCIITKLCRQYSWLRRHTYGGHAGITTELTDVGQTSPTRELLIPERTLDHLPSKCAGNDVSMSQIVDVSEEPQRDSLFSAPAICVRSDVQYTATTHDHKQAQSLLELESVRTFNAEASQTIQPSFKDPRIRVVAQMTAYPVLYVLLWIPGIINRGVEASGKTSVTLQYLQASTQLIGLVDTIIFAAQQRKWRLVHQV
jgi:hypothetical protein